MNPGIALLVHPRVLRISSVAARWLDGLPIRKPPGKTAWRRLLGRSFYF